MLICTIDIFPRLIVNLESIKLLNNDYNILNILATLLILIHLYIQNRPLTFKGDNLRRRLLYLYQCMV